MRKLLQLNANSIAAIVLSISPSIVFAGTEKQIPIHNMHNTTAQQSTIPVSPNSSDVDKITATLKTTFDRPNSPLVVFPVAVEGRHAVAGWSQDGRGGRAFLEKTEQGWLVRMCSGKSLTQINTLTDLGINPIEAKKITHKLMQQEATMNPSSAELLSSFEGTVIIGGKTQGTEHSAYQSAHNHNNAHPIDADK